MDELYGIPEMPDADEVFYEQLQHNTDVFAAFKVHRMQNDMAHMLLDSNGKLKTFEQWSNDVQTIASHQVGHWLQTEYDTAVIRAHQAADWQQFEREKDVLPNLKWMPSTSAHPGADHRVFWGTVRAINDPFWSSHRPGDRWNCKCSLSSTDEPITQVPNAAPSDEPQNGLENNPGTDAKAFSDSHPYFPANCASCDFYKGDNTGFTNRVKDCYSCKRADQHLPKSQDIKKELDTQKKLIIKNSETIRDIKCPKLNTGTYYQSKETLKRGIYHAKNLEEAKVFEHISEYLNELTYVRISPLGEGKDLTKEEDRNNIAKKINRGVTKYVIYNLKIGDDIWELKMEVFKDKNETLYNAFKKKKG
jgi:hypothetical protein